MKTFLFLFPESLVRLHVYLGYKLSYRIGIHQDAIINISTFLQRTLFFQCFLSQQQQNHISRFLKVRVGRFIVIVLCVKVRLSQLKFIFCKCFCCVLANVLIIIHSVIYFMFQCHEIFEPFILSKKTLHGPHVSRLKR